MAPRPTTRRRITQILALFIDGSLLLLNDKGSTRFQWTETICKQMHTVRFEVVGLRIRTQMFALRRLCVAFLLLELRLGPIQSQLLLINAAVHARAKTRPI